MRTASHADGFISTELLRETGEALFGKNWVTSLAVALNIRHDSVRHAATGKSKLSLELLPKLIALCEARGNEVAHIKQRLATMLHHGAAA